MRNAGRRAASGIDHNLHDIRATAISQWLSAGLSADEVAALVGHTRSAQTLAYARENLAFVGRELLQLTDSTFTAWIDAARNAGTLRNDDVALAASEITRRFAPGVWVMNSPPRLSQIATDWNRQGQALANGTALAVNGGNGNGSWRPR